MRYVRNGFAGLPTVELTRRNLRALLAKLDGHPPDSTCTLVFSGMIAVTSVEDSAHYSTRPPGALDDETEAALT